MNVSCDRRKVASMMSGVGGRVPHVISGRKFLSDKGELCDVRRVCYLGAGKGSQCDVMRVGCMEGCVPNLTL